VGRPPLLASCFDLQPIEPGRFVIACKGELALRLGAVGQEVTVTLPAGTRVEMLPAGLKVQKGRLVLSGAGATAPVGPEPLRRRGLLAPPDFLTAA
jgi:hypothetical protein